MVMRIFEKESRRLSPAQEINHETFTFLAWEAFNRKEYDDAIAIATRCILNYGATAWRLQKRIEEGARCNPNRRLA
jgi:hypothetical protein